MKKIFFLVFTSLMVNQSLKADVTLPKIFSDNMVIQRDVAVKV